jgi:hypothetical protein
VTDVMGTGDYTPLVNPIPTITEDVLAGMAEQATARLERIAEELVKLSIQRDALDGRRGVLEREADTLQGVIDTITAARP